MTDFIWIIVLLWVLIGLLLGINSGLDTSELWKVKFRYILLGGPGIWFFWLINIISRIDITLPNFKNKIIKEKYKDDF